MVPAVWRNWAGNQWARPIRLERPAGVAELAETVRRAAEEGLRVRALGSGHSFTAAAAGDGVMIRTDALDGVVQVDRDALLVTVEAGMSLRRLTQVLDAHGLALENMGDIDRQTVAGAISTGTHGTGQHLGGLASQVHALELIGADGQAVRCSEQEDPTLFAAARISLGALGVISRVTLRCVPAFHLHAAEGAMPLEEVLQDLDRLNAENDHFEFYWFPHTDIALTKRNNRADPGDDAAGPGRLRAWLDEEVLSNGALELVNRIATAAPALSPHLNALSARALSGREYTDAAPRVFTSPRRVVFAETEYAVPRQAAAEVVRELRNMTARRGVHTAFPVEVRFTAADDAWLSTAYGRDSTYIAVHQYHRMPYRAYFEAFAEIAAGVGGRPHWGKLHWLDAERLSALYPRFDDFRALRARMDPSGTFANPYLDRVLGTG
jgi:L-gulono-1,4-lactone dehydrogenase